MDRSVSIINIKLLLCIGAIIVGSILAVIVGFILNFSIGRTNGNEANI
jgi:hypothetical protein